MTQKPNSIPYFCHAPYTHSKHTHSIGLENRILYSCSKMEPVPQAPNKDNSIRESISSFHQKQKDSPWNSSIGFRHDTRGKYLKGYSQIIGVPVKGFYMILAFFSLLGWFNEAMGAELVRMKERTKHDHSSTSILQ